MENLKKFIYEHKMTLTISVICVIVAALVAALIFALVSQESKTTLKNNSSSQVISDGESTLSDNMSASSEGESDMSSQESNVENSSVNSADKSSGTTSTGNNNSASSNKTSSTGGNNQTPSTKYMEYTKYNLDTYLTPVWKNKVVYNESIMFFPNAKTKEYDPAPLLYTPTKVLSCLLYTSPGAVRENSVYDGEIYDARLAQPGWNCNGFVETEWEKAVEAERPGGVLSAQQMPPIRVNRRWAAVSKKTLSNSVVADFGQNFAGWVAVKVKGNPGSKLTIRYGETLKPDGSVNQDNLRGAKARDVYILNGNGEEEWHPRFTYHGFRYAQLERCV